VRACRPKNISDFFVQKNVRTTLSDFLHSMLSKKTFTTPLDFFVGMLSKKYKFNSIRLLDPHLFDSIRLLDQNPPLFDSIRLLDPNSPLFDYLPVEPNPPLFDSISVTCLKPGEMYRSKMICAMRSPGDILKVSSP